MIVLTNYSRFNTLVDNGDVSVDEEDDKAEDSNPVPEETKDD